MIMSTATMSDRASVDGAGGYCSSPPNQGRLSALDQRIDQPLGDEANHVRSMFLPENIDGRDTKLSKCANKVFRCRKGLGFQLRSHFLCPDGQIVWELACTISMRREFWNPLELGVIRLQAARRRRLRPNPTARIRVASQVQGNPPSEGFSCKKTNLSLQNRII